MLKSGWSWCLRTLLFLAIITITSGAQTLPIAAQRQGTTIWFVAQSDLTGFRAALYDLSGNAIADTGPEAKQRWAVETPKDLAPGVYLCVFWWRGQGEASKQLARLEVQTTTQTLQSAEQYLQEVEPPDSVFWGTPEYKAAERRAYERGSAAIPFFRTALKVVPDESAAYVFLVQAIRTKYARFNAIAIAIAPPPPPPPPPPAAIRTKVRRPTKSSAPKVESSQPQEPTAEENEEMLMAAQKAVSVAKACAEKTNALGWLIAVQGELGQQDAQVATLEQLAQASCATNKIRTQSWYAIGVIRWQCAYDLTTRYANRHRLANDPFHYRNVTKAADQQRVTACLQKAFESIEKALVLQPDYADAWSYRSLLYREKQKLTASPADRQTFSQQAEESARRAIELIAKQREQK